MNRLFKEGKFTTIIGVLVLIFTMAMLWFGKSTPAELSGWLAFATMMFRAKDSLLGIQEDK